MYTIVSDYGPHPPEALDTTTRFWHCTLPTSSNYHQAQLSVGARQLKFKLLYNTSKL